MIYAPIKPPIVLRGLTPIQRQYHHDTQHRFFVLPPGRRSRKTLISMRKVQYAAMRTKGGRYFHGAPIWSQAKDIFWERLKRNTRPFWAKEPSESDLAVFLKNGSEIHVEGLDKAERVEGQPWNGCHITEFPNTKPDAWPAHIRPVLSDTLGFAILDGVPEGRNHFYDLALYACNGIIPETAPFDGAFADNGDWCYYHWFSSDVLTASEIDEARRNLDERTFRQEYEGQFLSYEGVLYYNFDRQRNVSEPMAQYNPLCPLFLSTDFNKSPMVWLVGQLDGRTGRIIDELEISYNAKTQATAQLFCERYRGHSAKTVYVTGDASDNTRASGIILPTILSPRRCSRLMVGESCLMFRPQTLMSITGLTWYVVCCIQLREPCGCTLTPCVRDSLTTLNATHRTARAARTKKTNTRRTHPTAWTI
jgi:hypothetical protein